MRTGLTDVFAGTICSVLTITYSLSYAALIFSGPLAHFLSYGIAVTFMSAAVGGAYVALRSSLPFAVAGPDSSISVVIAALVATVLQRVAAGGDTDLLAAAIIAMALATALTGLLMCVLGFTHAGRAIRFLPYPVIGGFLGATGWFMVTGAIRVVTDQPATLDQSRRLRRGARPAPSSPQVRPSPSSCMCCCAAPKAHSRSPAYCWRRSPPCTSSSW